MSEIPQIDSIEQLAKFWDTHDVTDFAESLEEVREHVFDRSGEAVVRIHLRPDQAEALRRMAHSKGVNEIDLVTEWVSERLRAG